MEICTFQSCQTDFVAKYKKQRIQISFYVLRTCFGDMNSCVLILFHIIIYFSCMSKKVKAFTKHLRCVRFAVQQKVVVHASACLFTLSYIGLSLIPEPFRDVGTTYIWNKDTFSLASSQFQNSKSDLRTLMLEGRLGVLLLLWKEDWGSFSLLCPSCYSHKYAYRMYTELIPILYGQAYICTYRCMYLQTYIYSCYIVLIYNTVTTN